MWILIFIRSNFPVVCVMMFILEVIFGKKKKKICENSLFKLKISKI